VIVLLRGVPGSGKSTLARALAPHIHAIILDKDILRAALFPGDSTEYSTAQDDFVIGLMLQAARYHLERRPTRPVILDGRVHATVDQVESVEKFAASLPTPLRVIECTCSRDTALRRIEADLSTGSHLAGNRNAALLDAQLAKWQPLPYPVCTVDTEMALAQCVQQALRFLAQ
jgi:predicted kinase